MSQTSQGYSFLAKHDSRDKRLCSKLLHLQWMLYDVTCYSSTSMANGEHGYLFLYWQRLFLVSQPPARSISWCAYHTLQSPGRVMPDSGPQLAHEQFSSHVTPTSKIEWQSHQNSKITLRVDKTGWHRCIDGHPSLAQHASRGVRQKPGLIFDVRQFEMHWAFNHLQSKYIHIIIRCSEQQT